MKRLIATFVAALTFVAAMSTSVFAADYNLTISADKTIALPGETVKLSANLDTNVGIGSFQFAFTFDPNDFELVDDADTVEYEEENEVGLKSCISYDFVDAYFETYKAAQKWKYTTFGNQMKNGYQTVLFGYAKDTAIAAEKEIEDMLVGGALIKVKDTAAKEAKIWVTDIDCADGESVVKALGTNEITITTQTAPSLTVKAEKAWDTGMGLLVIAKVDGDYTTKGVMLTKDGADYVLPATSSNAGYGPKFAVTAPATSAGYYGLYIRDAAAGTYVAKAYADETVDTVGTTAIVAE